MSVRSRAHSLTFEINFFMSHIEDFRLELKKLLDILGNTLISFLAES